jgi:nucleolin
VQAAIRRFDGADLQGRSLIVKPWGSAEAYTLYAGNLSFDCRPNDLKEVFRSYGKVDNVEIAEHNGRSKGFGFVDFSSRDAAERALNALDGRDFQGRPLKVKWDRDISDAPPAQNDPPGKRMSGGTKGRSGLAANDGLPNTTVYIGNLDYDCRWQDLKQLFSKFGRVENVEILENPSTKRSKGYGTVQFLTSAQAKRAIEKVNGTEFQNRPIQVKWDRTKGVPEAASSKSPDKKARAPPPQKKEKRPEPPAPTLDGALSSSR